MSHPEIERRARSGPWLVVKYDVEIYNYEVVVEVEDSTAISLR